jgi:hypothetical protein
MPKYSLYRKDFYIGKSEICLLPTVIVRGRDWMYTFENFAIEFHFLCLHARLLWFKDNGLKGALKRRSKRGNEDV